MISSPSDYPALDTAVEFENLRRGLIELEKKGLVILDRLEDATLGQLQRTLRQNEYHIFHYIGHGGFDDRAQDGVLMLEDDDGRGRMVGGDYLGTLLQDQKTLRLALLNACEGAKTSLTDPFAGVAHSLVQHGIPAVIAMREEITDGAAILLASEFYGALSDGYPVDAALSEARKAIYAQGNDIEWGTPVLYLRSTDGKIFDLEAKDPTSITPRSAVSLPDATPASAPAQSSPAGSPAAQPVPAPGPGPASVASSAPLISLKRNQMGWIFGGLGLVAVIAIILLIFGAGRLSAGSKGAALQPTSAATSIAAVPPTNLPPPTETAPTDLPVTQAAVVPTLEPTPPPPTTEAAATEAAEQPPTETLSPTATEAAGGIPAPGQGDVIAFASDRTGTVQIWLMAVAERELVQLTERPEGACQPAWSPDGARLVFISPCPGNQESYPNSALFLINADGTGETQLTDGQAGDYDPDWSVTNLIAFTSLRAYKTQIFVLNPDSGGNPIALTKSSPNRDPSWSPDGSQIAFVTTRLGPQEIYTITAFGEIAAEGSNARQFTRNDTQAYDSPRWSPDGELLIYTESRPSGGFPDIIVSKVKDIGLTKSSLIPDSGKGPMDEPDFSPDSQWVVFEGWPQGLNHDIYRVMIDGLNREALTSDPALDFDPAWRPGSAD